jgi:RNA polymerase sigma factor (sigma-70 family)
MNENCFQVLVSQAKHGDNAAAAALLDMFEADVRIIVRAHLPRVLRTRFDSMDFVQAVWESLFIGKSGDEVVFSNSNQFRQYLAGIARNKVILEYRRCTRTKKYDIAREERLFVRREGRDEPREVPTTDPTPSQLVQASDRMRLLTQGRKPEEATVLQLRRQGLSLDEIASQTGLNERTIRRLIEYLREREERRRWE